MTPRMRKGAAGTGPGAIAPDGCAVERWLRLPVGMEPAIITRAVPAGASILELGCGVGRVTHPLLERGFTVTAVDESPEMLEHVRGARTVCSPIEALELGEERFDVVMLASLLIHYTDDEARPGLLRTCRRYVADDGCVLIQREGEDWHFRVPRQARTGDGIMRVDAKPAGPHTSTFHVEYDFPDARWTHTYVSRRFSKDEFEQLLADFGLAVDRYLDLDHTWVRARPV